MQAVRMQGDYTTLQLATDAIRVETRNQKLSTEHKKLLEALDYEYHMATLARNGPYRGPIAACTQRIQSDQEYYNDLLKKHFKRLMLALDRGRTRDVVMENVALLELDNAAREVAERRVQNEQLAFLEKLSAAADAEASVSAIQAAILEKQFREEEANEAAFLEKLFFEGDSL